MIKENEIRVGNYYNRINYNENKLGFCKWDASDWYRIGECIDYFEHYEPIPLTEDILLKKCGASKLPTKSGFVASYKLGSLTINRSSFGNYYYKKNVYNTVHQIQNLYHAIEQEELNVKL